MTLRWPYLQPSLDGLFVISLMFVLRDWSTETSRFEGGESLDRSGLSFKVSGMRIVERRAGSRVWINVWSSCGIVG